MKKLLILTFVFFCLVAYAQPSKYIGGDVSLLPSYLNQGTVYKDFDGKNVDLLPFLKQQGWNCIRVRLFVNPEYAPQANKDEGVCQDLNYVIKLGKMIKKAGLKLMLDFHYT